MLNNLSGGEERLDLLKIIKYIKESSRFEALKIFNKITENEYNLKNEIKTENIEKLLKAIIEKAFNLNNVELISYDLDSSKISLSIEGGKYLVNIYKRKSSSLFEDEPKTKIVFEVSPSNRLLMDSKLEIVLPDKLFSSRKYVRKFDLYLSKVLKHFDDLENIYKEVIARVPTSLLKLKLLSGKDNELRTGIVGIFSLDMSWTSKELDEILRWRLERIKSKIENQLNELLSSKKEKITL